MYQRQDTSRPRPVSAIIWPSDEPLPGASRRRLPIEGVTGSPDSAAEWRVWTSAARVPPDIHSVGASARPLSNTEDVRPDACAITNGAHCSPAAPGLLRSVSGRLASCSPTRVPPPGLLKTVRPSIPSFAPADPYREM